MRLKPYHSVTHEHQAPVFFRLLNQLGIEKPVAEYRFHKTRRWRFDWCFVENKLALEVEGGAWKKGGGRHNRGKGFIADMEKYNEAAIYGFRLIRVTPQQMESGEVVNIIQRFFEFNKNKA